MNWARRHNLGFEVSSRGDRRFSAFYAKFADGGLSIEETYQRAKGSGKGRPSIHPNFDYWKVYLGLWQRWAKENPNLMEDLLRLTKGKVLTDMFANTQNNQARALAFILTEMEV